MASSDFISDLYIADGYIDASYIADTYVEEGYVEGVITGSATLSPTFTVTASAIEIPEQGISLVAASATLTSSAERIRDVSANISSALSFVISANATKRPIADINPAFSQSTDAFRTRNLSATLYTTPDTWDYMDTWDQPTQERWSPVSVKGVLVVAAQASLSSEFGWSTSGFRTKNASSSLDAIVTQTTDALRSRKSSSTMLSTTTQTTDGLRGIFGSVDISGVLNFEVSAFRTRNTATLQASLGTLTADAERTRKGTILQASLGTLTASSKKLAIAKDILLDVSATLTASADRTRDGATLQASFGTLSVEGVRVVDFREAILPSIATVSIKARRNAVEGTSIVSTTTLDIETDITVRTSIELNPQFSVNARSTLVTGQADLSANYSVSSKGARDTVASATTSSQASVDADSDVILNASATLSAFNAVLSTLTVYKIDPYRVYAVKSEQRTLLIEEEARKKVVSSESRVNKTNEEQRVKIISSETRNLQVQTLRLVNTTGSPLDARN